MSKMQYYAVISSINYDEVKGLKAINTINQVFVTLGWIESTKQNFFKEFKARPKSVYKNVSDWKNKAKITNISR